QEGLGAVAGLLVEGARAAEVEAFGRVGVGDVHRLAGEGRVGRDHPVVGLAVLVELDRVERHRVAGGAAQVVLERRGAHDLEAQSLVVGEAIERAAVRAGDRLGRGENGLEQAMDVALRGERGADRVQLLQALAQVVRAGGRGPAGKSQALGGVEHLYLMQTERTSLMWVIPARHFSIPSCFSVRMPSSRDWERISATRACSWISFLILSLAIRSSCKPQRPLNPLPPHLSHPDGL